MSDNQPPGPWQQYPPANDGTWATPPEPTVPQYQPGSATPGSPAAPTYPPTAPYPGTGAEPTAPYQATPAYGQPGSGAPASYEPPAYTPGSGAPAAYEPPSYGQPTPGSGAPAYGQTPYAQAPYGQTPYAQSPYGNGTGWQTTPPKPRRTGLIVGIVVIALVVLCGGVAAIAYVANEASKPKHQTTATTGGNKTGGTTNTGGNTTTTPTIALGDGTALKGALLARPAGSKELQPEGGSNGVFTLKQFVKESFDNDQSEIGRLQERGFQVAAEEEWISDGIEIHIQLLQFTASSGALSYVEGQHGAYLDDSSVTDNYTVSGVRNGYGYEEDALDKLNNRRATLMCTQGNVAIVVFVFTPDQFDRPSEAAVLQKQSDKLAG